MKHRISTPDERVWCITQRAKLSFYHSIGRTYGWRFSIFIKSDLVLLIVRNVANVVYEPWRRPDLTIFFLHGLWSVIRLFGKFGPHKTKNIRQKKKGNHPRRSRLGVDTHKMCAKFHTLLKSAWTLRRLCRKRVFCVVQPSSRTWVRAHIIISFAIWQFNVAWM